MHNRTGLQVRSLCETELFSSEQDTKSPGGKVVYHVPKGIPLSRSNLLPVFRILNLFLRFGVLEPQNAL